jgi:hypothetical protein|tara:strand:- start:434 stop:853 length:420 start_codon:yes stop_codon:yes gene_type:complete
MRKGYNGLGYWELPKPDRGKEREWHTIARVSRTVPFGYEIDKENDKLLQPVFIELEALELAKRHLKQYTYKDVAIWLNKQTERYISSEGLRKRIKVEQKRKRSAKIKRELARRLKETLEEIQKLEEEGVGSYSNRERTT